MKFLSVPEEHSLRCSQKNPSHQKPSQCGLLALTDKQWTYGQSPIICSAVYGPVDCHLCGLQGARMSQDDTCLNSQSKDIYPYTDL